MDGDARLDPSSISLFSIGPAAPVSTGNEPHQQQPSSSTSQAVPAADAENVAAKGEGKFSAYKKKKSVEVIKRRNLIERLDKMKDKTRFCALTVPQLKNTTNNQLSIFMRRLHKSPDVRQHLSAEIMNRLFAGDEQLVEEHKDELGGPPKKQKQPPAAEGHKKYLAVDKQQQQKQQQLQRRFCYGPEHPLGRGESPTPKDEDTEQESTDYEDDDIYGRADELTLEKYELMEQQMDILAADIRAANIQADIRRHLKSAERQLSLLEEREEPFIFEQPADTGNEEEDSMSCARCRALLNRPKRALVRYDFDSERRNKSGFRPIIAHKRCGVEEYAAADGSIHPKLSLPPSIPLDAQMLKYLHVIDFVPAEIETRRMKLTRLMAPPSDETSQQQQPPPQPMFYNLEDELRDDIVDEDKVSAAEARAIKLSLPLRKAFKRRDRIAPKQKAVEETTATESDPNDTDYDTRSTSTPKGAPVKKTKRRRMTFSAAALGGGASKSSKLETRRTSHAADFGKSMFDYDAHVMDIGLPLPTIQKVENVEIAIPSFRKKSSLLSDFPSTSDTCESCSCATVNSPWEEIGLLHADLEMQEKNLRFRPPATASRKSTAHNLMMADGHNK